MAIRPDQSIPVILNDVDNINDKSAIRNYLLKKWINEEPNEKYRYFVETLINGNRIYLERPGRLNKGCDFIIYIENHMLYKNGNDKPPPHDFILYDLVIKKKVLTDIEWQNLINSITSIFNCQSYSIASQTSQDLNIVGESYEVILKTLRWLFIEQDITYWSGQGRSMLFDKILAT
jgi:hypothetical protein